MEGYVRMAVVPYDARQVVGPISRTHYNFNPWAFVEERDVEEMQKVTVQKGCACDHSAKVYPLFTTEEKIMNGQVVPIWSGKFGSPIKMSMG